MNRRVCRYLIAVILSMRNELMAYEEYMRFESYYYIEMEIDEIKEDIEALKKCLADVYTYFLQNNYYQLIPFFNKGESAQQTGHFYPT